jgi:hypothetical protein
VIWRKLDCLKPSLQKVQEPHLPERRPKPVPALPQGHYKPAAILRGAGAMPCQGIEGDERDA